jgi:hypothetical protein
MSLISYPTSSSSFQVLVVEKEMKDQLMSDYLDLLQTSKERPFHVDRGELFLLLSAPLELSVSSDFKYLHF